MGNRIEEINSIINIIHSLCARYNVTVWYTDKSNSSRLIHDILYYQAREYLKNV